MFQVRHILLVAIVALCCVAQFVVHTSCRSSDPLASVSSVALAQTPEPAKKKRDPKPPKPKDTFKLAAQLCVAAMQSGLAGSMDATVLAQYCVDMALELVSADYDGP